MRPNLSTVCAIGVMAKAPQAGRSKTRLCPPLLPAQAAALSTAFLRDVTENIAAAARSAEIAGLIAYAPAGSEALFGGHLAEGTGLLLVSFATAMAAATGPAKAGEREGAEDVGRRRIAAGGTSARCRPVPRPVRLPRR